LTKKLILIAFYLRILLTTQKDLLRESILQKYVKLFVALRRCGEFVNSAQNSRKGGDSNVEKP
jgi:hypothetical protein